MDKAARLVERDEIGERAAGVDTDADYELTPMPRKLRTAK